MKKGEFERISFLSANQIEIVPNRENIWSKRIHKKFNALSKIFYNQIIWMHGALSIWLLSIYNCASIELPLLQGH